MIIEQSFYILLKEVSLMTGWTLFLTMVGIAFLTAQLFRVIDVIERPAHAPHHTAARRQETLRLSPEVLRAAEALWNQWRSERWMFWKS
jgi:hypothetical protein